MKRNLVVLTMVIAVVALFSGCGKTVTPQEAISQQASDLATAQQKIAETYDPNDPESTAEIMQSYAELGAQMELQDFENAEAVDPPSDFPSNLIYDKGKITSSSDNGDETYVNKSVTIQTTEDFKTVKDFYKNLFSQASWKITSQSSESGGASYGVTDSSGFEASVDISSDPYSKLVTIYVWYSGSVMEF
ncbi:MAG: hypothetical protein ABIH78_02930 [Candidatus Peregrinibacteria bacterium]